MRLSWPLIIGRAAEIVRSYDTGVTLRQLFYRLVAEQLIENTKTSYSYLSDRTAKGRRQRTFPELIDTTRWIHRPLSFTGADDARSWLFDQYRRDRTETQDFSVYVGVEKRGMVEQLSRWFGETFGIPILPLGGYTSQTFVDGVRRDSNDQQRPAVLIYAGDFDPSGEDIDRDFIHRTSCFDFVERVALSLDQVHEFDLPPQLGKASDSRARAFEQRHGQLVQVELDALPPDELQRLYREAIEGYWDMSAFEVVLEQEERDREALLP
jgi:hypothetical protein